MKSGIYIYCNLVDGRKYVGQSINIDQRKRGHLSRIKNTKDYFHNALRKYGIKSFYVVKIQYSKKRLNEMEKYYIELFDTMIPSGYNLESGGNSNWKVSEETRKKMSDSAKGRVYSDEYKKNMSNILKGRKFTKKWRAKISEAKKGVGFSDEHRRKMSENMMGNRRRALYSDYQINRMRNMYKTYDVTVKSLSRKLNVNIHTLEAILWYRNYKHTMKNVSKDKRKGLKVSMAR